MIVNLQYADLFVLLFNVPVNNYGHVETVSRSSHLAKHSFVEIWS